jgi:sn-glycerol 3-phosphate transport system ATP-binding protein
MAEVRFAAVTKRFDGGVPAVDSLDLLIEDGEFMVLVGPSGCGKTTALRMIAGLEVPDDGTITIGEVDVTNSAPRDRDIAMVFQNYALYPHMTVARNLGFGLRQRRTPRAEIERRVAEVSTMLQLEPLLERKPSQLSGGQRQRVAMGRALARQPRVFLLDEPLSNLDAKLRMELRAELKRVHQQVATTSIYVTHDQVEAMTLGTRIAVMYAGRLQQVGTPHEVYGSPANLFVAQFIGSPPMNILDPELLGVSGALPGSVAGIRPEALSLASDDLAAGVLDTTVEVVEPLGSETVVYAQMRERPGRVIARLAADFQRSPGEQLRLAFSRSAVHVFGADGVRTTV